MTAMVIPLTGALSAKTSWDSFNWKLMEAQVYRLQMRIAKAYREGRQGKVKALQWILTHSFQAKLLATKRVVQNKGGKTPGVDRIIWRTSRQKIKAALSLQRRGYHTQPLRRIYIPKKKRPTKAAQHSHYEMQGDASFIPARSRTHSRMQSG